MRRPEFIARQARCPSGLLGHVLGRVMALETADDNKRAVELLAPQPADHVLEIGFGHGRSIARVAMLAKVGFVAGVEISERMLQMARRFNRRLIEQGRVDLRLMESSAIPYGDGRFDKVFSVHTIYFWPNPRETFAEIRRVMKPRASLVLGYRSGEDPTLVREFPVSIYRFYRSDEVRALLETVGFAEVRIVTSDGDPRKVIFAVARTPD